MEKGVRKDLVTMVEDIFGETRRKEAKKVYGKVIPDMERSETVCPLRDLVC